MNNSRLGTAKVPGLLLSLALPAISAQIVTLLYNFVDRIYIGRMEGGTIAMAAIGICAPITSIISGFTGLFGRGGAPLAAIQMGAGNHKKAEEYLGSSFIMLCITSILITLLCFVFTDPILSLFGASENTMAMSSDYLRVYILGTVFVQITVGMNYYITTQGFAKTAMLTTILGAAANIALDPIFIFALDMGITGAALATVLSQLISFIWVICFIFSKKTSLKIRAKNIRPNLPVLKEIIILGSAPFFMSTSEGVLHICFNQQVLKFGGDVAVSAMTILFSVFQFMLLPVDGVAQGSQPIISYNYGAKLYDRVRQTLKLAMSSTVIFTMIATAAVVAFPQFFIRIFNSDPELLQVGAPMLRVYVLGLFIMGINSTCQQSYNSLGEGGRAFFFAFLRKVILLIPLIYILPSLLPWGVMAVVLAEPISDILTTISNFFYFRYFIRKKLR